MLTPEDERFLTWWPENRLREKTRLRPLLAGASSGFVLGICIVVMLASGWDKQAAVVANTRLSSFILILAIIVISTGMGFLYRKFRWEMQEQRYLELKAKKNAYLTRQKQPS